MAEKKKTANLDRQFTEMNMSEIQRSVVSNYLGGIERERKPRPFMCWGAPGEGKTFTMIAAARELKRRLGVEFDFFDIPTSCLEPCDITGIPFPIKVEGTDTYSKCLAPSWAYLISKEYERDQQLLNPDFKANPAILMFDDVPAAHFQTQTAFFKGVHEGKWGEMNQRDNVMVVACGNRVEDNAGANDMPTALANRFEHAFANPTTDDWLKWGAAFREKSEPGKKNESRIHPLPLAFIRTSKDSLRNFDPAVALRDKAFASCRTWEAVSELHYEGQIGQDDPIFSRKLMGIVGRGVATEYGGFLRNSTSLVAPETIIADPHNAPIPSPRNLDSLHATISSLEMHLKQHPKESWKACMIYATRDKLLPDVAALLVFTISEVIADLPSKERNAAFTDQVFIDFLEKNEDFIDMVTEKG